MTRAIQTLLDTGQVRRPCPACEKQETTPFLVKNGLTLVRCTSCRMIYANEVASAFSSGSFYDESGHEYLASDKLGSDYADVRFERELRLFRRHCPGGQVLDVGCSSGGFLFQLKRRHRVDYTILGTDVSKAPLAHAASMGVPVVTGDFLQHSFEQQFDAVTFWAVMEHLHNPQGFLKKAAAILKPHGLCFILVPNMGSLAVKLLGAKYRYIFPEHINYFSSDTIRTFAERELDVLHISSSHFNPLVIWNDFRHGIRDVPRAERAALLRRTTAYKQSHLMLPIKFAYRASEYLLCKLMLADNLVLVGRKKAK